MTILILNLPYNKLQYQMKGKLQAIKDGDTNVYNHLIQVLKQMIVNNDMNGYQLFELYSQNEKNNVLVQDCFRCDEVEKLT